MAYDFRYRRIGEANWTELPNLADSTYTADGLLENTEYEGQYRPVGTIEYSPSGGARTDQALSAASAPAVTIGAVGTVAEDGTQQFTAAVSGGTYDTLTYAWTVVSGGGSITGAGGLYTPADVNADTSARVRCTVTARGTGNNALDGTSDTSTDTELFTVTVVVVAVAPGTPTIPTLVSRTANSVTVRTTPGSGGAVVTYRWRYSTNATVSNQDPMTTSAGPTDTISGLSPDTDYWIDVRGENDEGESVYSGNLATSTAVDDTTLPNAVAPAVAVGAVGTWRRTGRTVHGGGKRGDVRHADVRVDGGERRGEHHGGRRAVHAG